MGKKEEGKDGGAAEDGGRDTRHLEIINPCALPPLPAQRRRPYKARAPTELVTLWWWLGQEDVDEDEAFDEDTWRNGEEDLLLTPSPPQVSSSSSSTLRLLLSPPPPPL